jgi:hypothetical protein
MKGRIQGRRAKWLRVGFAVTVAITAHALNRGSAQAAAIDSTPAARTIVLAGIASSMTCTSGAIDVVPDALARVPIHSSGRLHAGFSSPTIVSNGTTYQETDALSATLSPKHSQLTGTWR